MAEINRKMFGGEVTIKVKNNDGEEVVFEAYVTEITTQASDDESPYSPTFEMKGTIISRPSITSSKPHPGTKAPPELKFDPSPEILKGEDDEELWKALNQQLKKEKEMVAEKMAKPLYTYIDPGKISTYSNMETKGLTYEEYQKMIDKINKNLGVPVGEVENFDEKKGVAQIRLSGPYKSFVEEINKMMGSVSMAFSSVLEELDHNGEATFEEAMSLIFDNDRPEEIAHPDGTFEDEVQWAIAPKDRDHDFLWVPGLPGHVSVEVNELGQKYIGRAEFINGGKPIKFNLTGS
jgi:hypothetical protein